MATGFQAANYLSRIRIVGRGGRTLRDQWADEPRAYLGITVPGFPNFFMLYGPGTNGGEIVTMLESQAEYAVRAVKRMTRERITAVEVKPSFEARWYRWLQSRMEGTSWTGTQQLLHVTDRESGDAVAVRQRAVPRDDQGVGPRVGDDAPPSRADQTGRRERGSMTHPYSYEGLHVVVTGAARGVGAALLELLAELDVAHVTAIDLNPPGESHDAFLAVDLSDEGAVRDAVTKIAGPVNVLFNNAGVADTQPADTVLSVNYLALRTLSEGLLDRMPEGSAIVNTASTAGGLWRKRAKEINSLLDVDIAGGWAGPLQWFEANLPALGQTPYNFSKEVVEVHTLRSSRPTMRRGVRTNAVCPGPIDTPLLPEFRQTTSDKIVDWNIREMGGRAVKPREVAMTLAFLGSPAASYLNGVNLDIDGGFNAAMATGQLDLSGRA